jgi:hypothetical protein
MHLGLICHRIHGLIDGLTKHVARIFHEGGPWARNLRNI